MHGIREVVNRFIIKQVVFDCNDELVQVEQNVFGDNTITFYNIQSNKEEHRESVTVNVDEVNEVVEESKEE